MKPINFIDLIAARLGGLPPAVVGTWIVMGLLLIFGVMARRALNAAVDPLIPDAGMTLRGFGEVIAEWLDGFVANVSELHGSRKFVPFFGSIFLFILTANFFGMIPGMEPPTGDTNLTFALGAICFAFYLYQGFKTQG
ncbi:MAG: F0F1 ATP synthase subunit A, partial [Acidobacteriota bacterium]|nr:F0F1 ATP synthase subunit A [Acidobacteriota bacterium]